MNEKYRLPLSPLIALAVVAVVVVAVVGLGSLGSSATSAALDPFAHVRRRRRLPAPTPTDPRSTPEGATRAFFAAYAKARKTDDPSLGRALCDEQGLGRLPLGLRIPGR